MDCLACMQQGQGHAHTCDESGLAVAVAAREAGVVADPPAVLAHDVTVTAVVVGTRMSAEYVAAVLQQHCEQLGDVTEYSFSVAERV